MLSNRFSQGLKSSFVATTDIAANRIEEEVITAVNSSAPTGGNARSQTVASGGTAKDAEVPPAVVVRSYEKEESPLAMEDESDAGSTSELTLGDIAMLAKRERAFLLTAILLLLSAIGVGVIIRSRFITVENNCGVCRKWFRVKPTQSETVNCQQIVFVALPLLASALTLKEMSLATHVSKTRGKRDRGVQGLIHVAGLLQLALDLFIVIGWFLDVWGDYRNSQGLLTLVMAAMATIIFHAAVFLLRQVTVRREGPGTWAYVRRVHHKAMLIIIIVQFICAVYVFFLCTGHPWVSSHFDEALEQWLSDGVDCIPVNQSYVAAHCTVGPVLNEHRWSEYGAVMILGCDDGGYGIYKSQYDACSAKVIYVQIQLRARAGSLASSYALLAYLVAEFIWAQDGSGLNVWLSEPLTTLRRNGVIATAALCWLVGSLSIPVLVVNMLLPEASFKAEILFVIAMGSAVAWSAAITMLVVEVLRNRVQTAVRGSDRRFDIFLTHDWSEDSQGRDNHRRVEQLNDLLKRRGARTWFDQERMRGDVIAQMTNGIDHTDCVGVFITPNYVNKVAGEGARGFDDNCKFEFDYSRSRLGVKSMIPIVMDPSMRDQSKWKGAVGMTLGTRLYIDASGEITDEIADKIYMEIKDLERTARPDGSRGSMAAPNVPRQSKAGDRKSEQVAV